MGQVTKRCIIYRLGDSLGIKCQVVRIKLSIPRLLAQKEKEKRKKGGYRSLKVEKKKGGTEVVIDI
jgi:hypothetical protein